MFWRVVNVQMRAFDDGKINLKAEYERKEYKKKESNVERYRSAPHREQQMIQLQRLCIVPIAQDTLFEAWSQKINQQTLG